jgi:hypothetical protein
MRKKRNYKAPSVKSEPIRVGVFGDYGTPGSGKLKKDGSINPCTEN